MSFWCLISGSSSDPISESPGKLVPQLILTCSQEINLFSSPGDHFITSSSGGPLPGFVHRSSLPKDSGKPLKTQTER